MAHYAKIEDGVVTEVIVADEAFVKKIGGEWVQTSYNTHAGQHPDGKPMRKNFAGKGMIYDKDRDAFYTPQPYPSWILNEETCIYEAPVPMPQDGKQYLWDESVVGWIVCGALD